MNGVLFTSKRYFYQKNINRLVVIEGPTASGKTALTVAVAHYFNTVILSADSRQFYKEMSIGTAKPSQYEMQGIPHYFIDSHSIEQELTAATYAEEARDILQKEFKTHPTILLTGGSGMYVDALCKGLDNVPVSLAERDKLNIELKNNGLEPLLRELETSDPVHFDRIDKANPVRVIRALEVIRSTGKPYSSFLNIIEHQKEFEVIRFRIDHPREQLYRRIDQRVDQMMVNGLLEEVCSLLPYRNANVLKTVGYQELFDYIDGKLDLPKAIELIKQHTRNYAKRQLTWLRRNEDAISIPFSSVEEMLKKVTSSLEHLGISQN